MNKLMQTLGLAMAGLRAVDQLADDARLILGGGSATYDQLKTIVSTLAAIANAIRDGIAGGDSHVDAIAELEKLSASIAGNNAAADAAVDAKFPAGE